jgi:hypothetical protein
MLAAMEVGIPKKGRAWGGKIAYPADDDDGEDKESKWFGEQEQDQYDISLRHPLVADNHCHNVVQ